MPIIKAIHYKTQYGSKAKVAYILKDGQDDGKLIDENTLLLNFTKADPDRLHKDFLRQASYLKKRKNGNKLFHFIVSFSPKDSANITTAIMMDMMRKFVALRDLKRHVVLGKIHKTGVDHFHFHILASSNELRSSRPKRFNKSQLKKLFKELEIYQKEKYGKALAHSFVVINKPEKAKNDLTITDKNQRREREYQMKERIKGKGKTKKEIAKEILNKLLEKSSNFDQFVKLLDQQTDFELYSYRGKIKGCWYAGRKFRFKTLGCQPEKIQELDLMAQRLKQLERIRETFKGRDLGLGR